ncbi:hypothetical protein [Rhodococcus opacus]|uniref:hypothetical protein n=1 Tax=Rhodococcus opacus TaxID=37919 RepID=UPI00294ADB33|nr:hypothetical protein [Rhodococcus opacus]
MTLAAGLTDSEINSVHARFGVGFASDHLDLLRTALPLGDRWPNWRDGDDAELQRMLDWPIESFVWDVLHQPVPFWPALGPTSDRCGRGRVDGSQESRKVARAGADLRTSISPAAPAPPGCPVFSVYQTDLIYYGPDLVEYLRNELKIEALPREEWTFGQRVPYWLQFVEAANRAECI